MTGVQTCALPICFPVTIGGGAGMAVSGLVNTINPENIENTMGLVTQLVILVATLIGLFKKKKPKMEEKSKYLENE